MIQSCFGPCSFCKKIVHIIRVTSGLYSNGSTESITVCILGVGTFVDVIIYTMWSVHRNDSGDQLWWPLSVSQSVDPRTQPSVCCNMHNTFACLVHPSKYIYICGDVIELVLWWQWIPYHQPQVYTLITNKRVSGNSHHLPLLWPPTRNGAQHHSSNRHQRLQQQQQQ